MKKNDGTNEKRRKEKGKREIKNKKKEERKEGKEVIKEKERGGIERKKKGRKNERKGKKGKTKKPKKKKMHFRLPHCLHSLTCFFFYLFTRFLLPLLDLTPLYLATNKLFLLQQMCSIAQHIPRHGSKPQSQLCIICRLSSSSSYYSCSCVQPQ